MGVMDLDRDLSYRDDAPGGARIYACRGCGSWLVSQEYDGWCLKCCEPGSVAYLPAEWAGTIGATVAMNIGGDFSEAAIYRATKRAAGFALDFLGREAGSAAA
jgi:hypothetical protein